MPPGLRDERQKPMRGRMLWFNEVKDSGMVLSDDGERLLVSGRDFTDGKRPCAKKEQYLQNAQKQDCGLPKSVT